jgi:hypothetical protein
MTGMMQGFYWNAIRVRQTFETWGEIHRPGGRRRGTRAIVQGKCRLRQDGRGGALLLELL